MEMPKRKLANKPRDDGSGYLLGMKDSILPARRLRRAAITALLAKAVAVTFVRPCGKTEHATTFDETTMFEKIHPKMGLDEEVVWDTIDHFRLTLGDLLSAEIVSEDSLRLGDGTIIRITVGEPAKFS